MKQAAKREEIAGTIQKVLGVFQEINKVQNISKVQLFDLVKFFKQQPTYFQEGWEVAYLKIFKIFHERANRKMPPKYQKLATDFFNEILPSREPQAIVFYDYFVQFLAESVFSSLIGIRITAARMLFHLLKNHSNVGENAQRDVLKSVFYLVRLKVSTYKQVGIKLASIVLGWEGVLRDKIQEELFKIMAVQENEQIRKMSITNLWVKKYNLDRVLLRLRDKCVDIRNIIMKKLVGEKYDFEETMLAQRYRLLYDGYGNKQPSVQQETIKFLLIFFDKADNSQSFLKFIEMFAPDTILAHPHLYNLLDLLIVDIVEEIPINQISDFMRRFTSQLRTIGKGGAIHGSLQELIWLKNIGRSDNSQLRALFEESVPTGMELARILSELIRQKDAFSIFECLQLFSLQKSSDEIGRNKMFDSLKKMMIELEYWAIKREVNMNEKDDVCPNLTEDFLKQKKMLLSYFDLPPISCSFDLLFEAGRAMKALWPDHFQIELRQLMADWNNPEENNLFKEKQLAQTNVKKAEGHADVHLMNALKQKLQLIQQQISRQNAKTIILIQTLLRLKPTASLEDYMMIIRKQLAQPDQTQGLLLLGYYCLEEQDRAENFLPIYWVNIANPNASKLALLISLKVTFDFFAKFDFTEFKPLENGSSEEFEPFQYENYLRKLQEIAIDGDPQTKILAIQGLCRLIFQNRVPDEHIGSCFMRILLLWWETSSEEVSARSVHTISIFIKQYIEKGQRQVRKLSEWLCVFFKTILINQHSRRMINKKKIVYNLKIEEFIKRAIIISMTVLKYQKQSRQVIWKYQEAGAELGPQELFLLFLFKHKEMHYCLEKALNICDFYEEAPLETLILVKKQVENILENGSFGSQKKIESTIKKLQADIEERIQIKNKETFNEELLNGLKQELHQYELLIDSAGTSLEMELRDDNIFIQNPDAPDHEEESNIEPEEEEVEGDLADIEDIIPNEESKNQKKAKAKTKMIRISEKNEHEQEQNSSAKKKQEESILNKNKRRTNTENRRRLPESDEEESESVVEAHKNRIIAGRTRSRVNI